MKPTLLKKSPFKRTLAMTLAAAVAASSVSLYVLADNPNEYIMADAGKYQYSEDDAFFAATHFHMFAKDSLDISTHCNGNFATSLLTTGTHYGTNQSAKYYDGHEVSYTRRFLTMDTGPVVSDLVLGKDVHAYYRDNGNALTLENDISDIPQEGWWVLPGVVDMGNTGLGAQTSPGRFDHITQDKGSNYYIDLDAEFAKLTKLSSDLANKLEDTDGVKYENGKIIVSPETADKRNVITIRASEAQWHSDMVLEGLDLLAGGQLIVNFVMDGGDTRYITKMVANYKYSDEYIEEHKDDLYFTGYYDGHGEDKGEFTNHNNILWNVVKEETHKAQSPWDHDYKYYVPYTDEITFNLWQGEVLAPQADIKLGGGNFDGNAIGRTITTGGESHRWDFGGQLPKFSDDNKYSFSFEKIDSETNAAINDGVSTFKLTGPNGYEQIAESDSYGVIEFTNLEAPFWGESQKQYQLTEISAPDGYTRDENTYTVTVKYNQQWQVEITQSFDNQVQSNELPQFKNTHKKASIVVEKEFEDAKDTSDNFVSGSKFSMFESYDGMTLTDAVFENMPVKNMNGKLLVTFGPFNTPSVEKTFFIKETSAPEGYDVSEKIIECKVYANGNVTYREYGSNSAFTAAAVKVLNELHKEEIKATILSKKVYENSQITADLLTKTEFGLYETAADASAKNDKVIGTAKPEKIGNDAVISFEDLSAPEDEAVIYYLTETKAPFGYELSDKIYECKVNTDGSVLYREYGKTTAFTQEVPVVVNGKIEDPVVNIEKTFNGGVDTPANVDETIFALYDNAACTGTALETSSPVLSIDQKKFEVIFDSLTLPTANKTYFIKEVATSEGYEGTDKIIEVKVTTDGEVSYRIAGSNGSFANEIVIDNVKAETSSEESSSEESSSEESSSSEDESSETSSEESSSSEDESSETSSEESSSSEDESSETSSEESSSSEDESSETSSEESSSSEDESSETSSEESSSSEDESSETSSEESSSSEDESSETSSEESSSSEDESSETSSEESSSSEDESSETSSTEESSSEDESSETSSEESSSSEDESSDTSSSEDSSSEDESSETSSTEESSDVDEDGDDKSSIDESSSEDESSETSSTEESSDVDEDSDDNDSSDDGDIDTDDDSRDSSSDESDEIDTDSDENSTDTDGNEGTNSDDDDTDSDHDENVPTGGKIAGVSLLVISGGLAILSLRRKNDEETED